ncbi:MAG: topoisomerase II [Methylomonas sp.]|nr:MAG: topoisomerase II [Methylomonas sp.]PPD26193.1 MAG: topoisomerase II [Methylomonas sp.]PPD37910.1 MAG: topoisomerase II [Methylomonas sp.]PPD42086.1 MAG: topoisomerase II [Methylomonas sp.]PPD53625.1 MAG: topoisomerase II [Methylomonas sp.]
MAPHQFIRFRLDLGYVQYLAVYQGIAKTVVTTADDGRRIEFPVANIHRYLDISGIHGYFEMELTEQNKFVGIRRLA